MTQLLLSSHSPAILRALEPVESGLRGDAIFLDVVTRVHRGEPRSRVTRHRAIGGPQQLRIDDLLDVGKVVSPMEIAEFEVQVTIPPIGERSPSGAVVGVGYGGHPLP